MYADEVVQSQGNVPYAQRADVGDLSNQVEIC